MLRSSRPPDNPSLSSRTSGTRSAGASDGSASSRLNTIREKVQRRLLMELSSSVRTDNFEEVERALKRIFGEVLAEENLPLSRAERAELLSQIVASVLGFGVLEPLLQDESITEVLVNGPDQVFVERRGKLERTDIRFRNVEELMRIIERIVAPLGRRVDESSPLVDARLPDGSRVNVIIPPLSLVGPCLSIRKFSRGVYSMERLVEMDTLTKEMGDFLRACVLARLNIVVAGGTSTGKTTMLNILSSFIPDHDRIVTIEDSAELQLQQEHVVRLEARPPNVEGKGQVTIRQLVINSLRMRPDRIVVGEVRGGEALDMLQAMNTGHDGSLTTAHANSPRDTLRRVETMVLMAGMDLPLRAVREQIAAAFDLIVQLERLPDGNRRVTEISEVQGMEGDTIVMQDIFRYVQTEYRDGRVQGYFTGAGIRPKFMEKLEAWGLYLPPTTFAVVKDRVRRS
jgi:pilus assembly protein CpaF